jgi:hypothetical protein
MTKGAVSKRTVEETLIVFRRLKSSSLSLRLVSFVVWRSSISIRGSKATARLRPKR